jgi:hypothetical protein
MKLTDPYPCYTSNWKVYITIIFISLFVGVFLVLFKPFGLYTVQMEYRNLWIGGYGVVTFFVLIFCMVLLPMAFPRYFSESNWTVIKEMTFILFIIFLIGLANYAYTRYLFGFPGGGWRGVLLFQFYTLVVGIFPTVFITVANYNRLLKQNLRRAEELGPAVEKSQDTLKPGNRRISLNIEADEGPVQFDLSQLCYIKSEGNYVSLCFSKDGQADRSLIRYTMKRVEQDLKAYIPPISRTHRSYFVNLDKVKGVSGNSQGLVLSLNGIEERVPVSRAYVDSLKSLLGKIQN